MASITFLKDRIKKPYRAQIRNKKYSDKAFVDYFPTEDEAKEWIADRERDIRRALKGMEPVLDNLQKRTVETLVREYLKRRTPKKASRLSETKCLEYFLE